MTREELLAERFAPVDRWVVELPVSVDERAAQDRRRRELCQAIDGFYIDDRPSDVVPIRRAS